MDIDQQKEIRDRYPPGTEFQMLGKTLRIDRWCFLAAAGRIYAYEAACWYVDKEGHFHEIKISAHGVFTAIEGPSAPQESNDTKTKDEDSAPEGWVYRDPNSPEIPVPEGWHVQVQYGDGRLSAINTAAQFNWHCLFPKEKWIAKYRVIKRTEEH